VNCSESRTKMNLIDRAHPSSNKWKVMAFYITGLAAFCFRIDGKRNWVIAGSKLSCLS